MLNYFRCITFFIRCFYIIFSYLYPSLSLYLSPMVFVCVCTCVCVHVRSRIRACWNKNIFNKFANVLKLNNVLWQTKHSTITIIIIKQKNGKIRAQLKIPVWNSSAFCETANGNNDDDVDDDGDMRGKIDEERERKREHMQYRIQRRLVCAKFHTHTHIQIRTYKT